MMVIDIEGWLYRLLEEYYGNSEVGEISRIIGKAYPDMVKNGTIEETDFVYRKGYTDHSQAKELLKELELRGFEPGPEGCRANMRLGLVAFYRCTNKRKDPHGIIVGHLHRKHLFPYAYI